MQVHEARISHIVPVLGPLGPIGPRARRPMAAAILERNDGGDDGRRCPSPWSARAKYGPLSPIGPHRGASRGAPMRLGYNVATSCAQMAIIPTNNASDVRAAASSTNARNMTASH